MVIPPLRRSVKVGANVAPRMVNPDVNDPV